MKTLGIILFLISEIIIFCLFAETEQEYDYDDWNFEDWI